MDSFLYWYSQNNKIIIQALFVCIGLVLIYLVYRMFFVAQDAQQESVPSKSSDQSISNKQLADLDKKLTSILEMQTAPVVNSPSAASTTSSDLGDASASASGTQEEIAQLRNEIKQVNEQLEAKNIELAAVKEKIAEQQKVILEQATTAFSNSNTTTDLTGDEALVTKIDELQKKLQEYDIISDDIAELQSLRAENAELKSKIDAKPSAG